MISGVDGVGALCAGDCDGKCQGMVEQACWLRANGLVSRLSLSWAGGPRVG